MNEFDAIFDAVIAVTAEVHKADAIHKKEQQIASVLAARCGNCDHWMKTSCKPEKERGEFKSMNSVACPDFRLGFSSQMLAEDFRKELRELERAD